MGVSQYRLAKEIGVPAQRIGEIVAGRRDWRPSSRRSGRGRGLPSEGVRIRGMSLGSLLQKCYNVLHEGWSMNS
jgi:hypothetical protein